MSKINKSMSYITGQIRYICSKFKNRSGGSQAERDCQEHFAEELNGWSDSVEKEEFTIHPKAFLGWIIPAGVLDVASVILYWLYLRYYLQAYLIASIACVAVSILMFLLEFVLYKQVTDWAYPATQSLNVFARQKPKGETRRRIVFCGHADAAYEMTYILYRNANSVYTVIAGAVIGMVFMLAAGSALLLNILLGGYDPLAGIWRIIGLVGLCFIPFFLAIMFFINWSKVVDGANDNLTGCLVSMSVLRNMAAADKRLQHTELCCLITGGEEEGLRGATAFANRHKHDFEDVETVFIVVDTLREISQLQVYTRGMNGTQRNSEYAADILRQAGENCGVELDEAGSYPGATDAEALSREGLIACGLGGVNHIPQTYYHTRHDTADNIDEGCIKLSLDICMEAARVYDAQAASGDYVAERCEQTFASR